MATFTELFTHTRGTGATRINSAGLIVGVDFSSTSVTFGTGNQTFVLAADANVNRDWTVGEDVRAMSQAGNLGEMIGTVVSYTPSTQTLVINVVTSSGTGASTDWRIGSLEVRRDADGVLREPLRSNLFINSNTGTAVNGTLSAVIQNGVFGSYQTFTPDIGSSSSIGPVREYSALIPTTDQSISVGVETTARYIYFSTNNAGAQSNVGIVGRVDTLNLSVVILRNVNAILYSTKVERASGNWIRLNITFVHLSNSGAKNFGVACTNELKEAADFSVPNTVYLSVFNNALMQTFNVTAWQYEKTSSSMSSYIPTTTVAVTRNADNFALTPSTVSRLSDGTGSVLIEANATDAGTVQRAALRLTGPSGEIRIGKQGVTTNGNFTKMTEGGGVQLLGNATQGITNNGLEYGLFAPIDTRNALARAAFPVNNITYNGSTEFGLISGAEESTVNSTFTTIDAKGLGNLTLNGAHYNGSRFLIATGANGVVGISTDGISGRRISTPVITQPCNEITSGMVGPTMRNVIVGNAGFIATSDDNGETWVSRVSGASNTLNAVTYGSLSGTNMFLIARAGGGLDGILSSTDGISWAVAHNASPNSRIDVHISNGIAVSVGGAGIIYTSVDGVNWVLNNNTNTTQTLNGVHYNASANLWVAVGANGTIITATDPAGTWTLQENIGGTLNEVNFSNGLWIVVGSNNGQPTLHTSPNAITFTLRVTGLVTGAINGIATNGSRVIITGAPGSFASSEDGLTYTSRTNNNGTLNSIAFGGGVYVSVGNAINGSGYIATIDTNGTVTRRVSNTTANMGSISYIPQLGKFFAVAGNAAVLSSVDGITFTQFPLITGNSTPLSGDFSYGNGILLFASGASSILRLVTSNDNGVSFVANNAVGVTVGLCNHFANGIFVIGCAAGQIVTTTDGITLTPRASGTTQNIRSVIYSQRDQRWYAAGDAGTLLFSFNAFDWFPVNNTLTGAIKTSTGIFNLPVEQPLTNGRQVLGISYGNGKLAVSADGRGYETSITGSLSITGGTLADTFNGKITSFEYSDSVLTLEQLNAITKYKRK